MPSYKQNTIDNLKTVVWNAIRHCNSTKHYLRHVKNAPHGADALEQLETELRDALESIGGKLKI